VSEPSRLLVLASSSPRRQDLLRDAGFRFQVVAPDVDESARPGEAPGELARRLAGEKAGAVAPRVDASCCVLAADTVVVIDGDMIGKPRDEAEAAAMLLRLAGREHRVLTGVALAVPALGRSELRLEESFVRMARVTVEEARAYAATGEPLDKAGAYALQGEGGRFVARVRGSRSNVIGLPLEAVVPLLRELGVSPACPR
jgi:septum formation protein